MLYALYTSHYVLLFLAVISGSRDATLRVWNIETGECTKTLSGHVAAVRWCVICVAYVHANVSTSSLN